MGQGFLFTERGSLFFRWRNGVNIPGLHMIILPSLVSLSFNSLVNSTVCAELKLSSVKGM